MASHGPQDEVRVLVPHRLLVTGRQRTKDAWHTGLPSYVIGRGREGVVRAGGRPMGRAAGAPGNTIPSRDIRPRVYTNEASPGSIHFTLNRDGGRVASPQHITGLADTLRNPAYATSVGLLGWGLHHHHAQKRPTRPTIPLNGSALWMNRFRTWLDALLPG